MSDQGVGGPVISGSFSDQAKKFVDSKITSFNMRDRLEHNSPAFLKAINVTYADLLFILSQAQDIYAKIKANQALDPDTTFILNALTINDTIASTVLTDVGNTYISPLTNPYKLFGIDIDVVGKLLQSYSQYKIQNGQSNSPDQPKGPGEDYIATALKHVVNIDNMEPALDFIRNNQTAFYDATAAYRNRPNTEPAPVNPWQCRIGGSTFFVPPTNINVSQTFRTGSLSGGTIRQANTAKFNSGHSETVIEMTLYFPNSDTIWGFMGNSTTFNFDPVISPTTTPPEQQGNPAPSSTFTSDAQVDFFLSSLRGLITQFKYAPFLPIKNEYLNQNYGITGVVLQGMTVSTVEGFPFCVSVTLQMAKFNHKVYLPMIDDFNQAVHWGKFRQYIGRGAERLNAIVNQGFVAKRVTDDSSTGTQISATSNYQEINDIIPINPEFNKIREWNDGRNFDLYYPTTTPAQIFAPDLTDFRTPGEDLQMDSSKWGGLLDFLGINIVDRVDFNQIQFDQGAKDGKYRNERNILVRWLQLNNVMLAQMDSSKLREFLDAVEHNPDFNNLGINLSDPVQVAQFEAIAKQQWFYHIWDLWKQDTFFQQLINNRSYKYDQYVINEWKVPMEKLNIDWSKVFIEGITVSLSNTFASLQNQMQDEPVYQHLGGGDSTVSVSMVVVGEQNLSKFRRMFELINNLARLEHAHGVLGFVGVKNILTALCGIKYALPLGFEVDTIPNYPHIYSVRMSFIDFDVFQQRREQLSSGQQKQLVEFFGKRNPFLRLKQLWAAFNAYPDFPLEVRNDKNEIVGHLDPDFYYRTFTPLQDDIFNTGSLDLATKNQLVSNVNMVDVLRRQIAADPTSPANISVQKQIEALVEQQKQLVREKGYPSDIYIVDSRTGELRPKTKAELAADAKTAREKVLNEDPSVIRHFLGPMNKDQAGQSIVAIDDLGKVSLGNQDDAGTFTPISNGVGGTWGDDTAATNRTEPFIPDITIPPSAYQNTHTDGGNDPSTQYRDIIRDAQYREISGRMIRAFPTYMLWLIDEGGRYAGVKLFDNFYGLQSIMDMSVMSSEDSLSDTLVFRVSNLYSKLTTPYRDQIATDDPNLGESPLVQLIDSRINEARNLRSGMTNYVVDLESIRLKPGVRIHLRMGYSADPNALQTVFNGTITEVEQGDVLTVTCQSDAVELSPMVNTTNKKGDSGHIDGGINTGFWMSEPRDLMVRLMSMGSSNFKEWVAWSTQGMVFSENRFGIRHFGSVLYEPLNDTENAKQEVRYAVVQKHLQQILTQGGGAPGMADLGNIAGLVTGDNAANAGGAAAAVGYGFSPILGAASGLYNSPMIALMNAMWINSFRKRDYELFKRNIYPGNGLGIAQYMGGDMYDGGLMLAINSPALARIAAEQAAAAAAAGTPNPSDQNAYLDALLQSAAVIDSDRKNRYQDATDAASLLNNNDYIPPDYVDTIKGMSQSGGGLWDSLLDVGHGIWDILELPGKGIHAAEEGWDWVVGNTLGRIPILGPTAAKIVGGAGDIALNVTALANPTVLITKGADILGGLASSPVARALGLWSMNDDDDLQGFDEVSFRAQTYMKSVWDIFQVCAGLQPNYIVAVRPFEDRSTIFYGKPHWLYTSGVLPVTTGFDPEKGPKIEAADAFLQEQLANASQAMDPETQQSQIMNDIANIQPSDPFATTAGLNTTTDFSAPVTPPSGTVDDPIITDFERELPVILATIRYTEGGNSYTAKSKGSSASGAYQFVDSTWKNYNKDYTRASDAPPEVQDAVAAQMARDMLGYGVKYWGKPYVRAIFVGWYALTGVINWDKVKDTIPMPEAGNKLTFQQYAHLQIARYLFFRSKMIDPNGKPTSVDTTSGDFKNGVPKDVQAADAFLGSHQLPGSGTNFGTPAVGGGAGGGGGGTGAGTTGNTGSTGWVNTLLSLPTGTLTNEELSLLKSNPISFAYKFGWKYDAVPAWIDPNSGYGYDPIGSGARNFWDEKYSNAINVPKGSGRKPEEAEQIWDEFRHKFASDPKVKEIYHTHFPTTESADKYNNVVNLFIRFMWMNPEARGWLVINADKKNNGGLGLPTLPGLSVGPVDLNPFNAVPNVVNAVTGANVIGGGRISVNLDGSPATVGNNSIVVTDSMSDNWTFGKVETAWNVFLTSTDHGEDSGRPVSSQTIYWLKQHNQQGADSNTTVGQIKEDIDQFMSDNIGSIMGMIGDSISGLISMVRLSLNQLGQGLSMAGTFQKQANILNRVFNDSIYYSAGAEGSLERLVDNPFTREYGEPVVEIREPFQRVHFLSSYQHILDNGISENLSGVPTVITAVSDGKYPVTVHFDKSMSPDRQVESVIETGLYWDNARGSGLTGIFHPLLHPLETLRGVTKTMTGSSDQISSRRIALYHLKQGLQDVYTGELLILGNPDIRPHDLVFLADVYSRMYGMFEVEQVEHHLTPENGFVTSITPNAIVTINDPGRWSGISWLWKKWSDYNIRNDTRQMMGIKAASESAIEGGEITSEQVPYIYYNQLLGALQYTHGKTALIKDIASNYAAGGLKFDQAENTVSRIEAGIGIGTAIASTTAPGFGFWFGDLAWDAWGWVRDNLLDQHGCYIQYLNKNGQPMDAGMSTFQGVAVGQSHSISLFPALLGLTGRVTTTEDGHYRITTDDLLSALGWQEIDITGLKKETSMFVDMVNANILRSAGKDPDSASLHTKYEVFAMTVTDVIDGDTIKGFDEKNEQVDIRFALVNTPEIWKGQNVDLNQGSPDFDAGGRARDFIVSRIFANPGITSNVVIRYDPTEPKTFGRIVGTIFHNAPAGTPPEKRIDTLKLLAQKDPPTPWDGYLDDGRPYTLNWDLIINGLAQVDMRLVWNTDTTIVQGVGAGGHPK